MAAAAAKAALPVAIEEVKAFLRIAGSEEDALLAGLVRSAAELCEAFTGLTLIESEAAATLVARGDWMRIGRLPVREILEVAGIRADGGETPLASGDYAVDIDAAGDGWARVTASGVKAVRVRYRAGLAGDLNGVPEPLRHGIVRMAAHLYTHRDGSDGPPAAVAALWLPFRRLRLC